MVKNTLLMFQHAQEWKIIYVEFIRIQGSNTRIYRKQPAQTRNKSIYENAMAKLTIFVTI